MKIILIAILCCLTTAGLTQTGIQQMAVTGQDTKQYPLSGYGGKTLWIVLLPTTRTSNDSAFLKRIDSVALARSGSLQVIAVPSYEDGYTEGDLMDWYRRSLGNGIVLSRPLYTHRSSGGGQDNLFSWLTHAGQNGHFDNEVPGAGGSYFINPQGLLYAVFDPASRFSNRAMNRVLP